MKDARITIRMDAEELAQLEKSARQMKIPAVALARICIRDWLTSYDWKHDLLVERLAALQGDMERNLALTAGALAAAVVLRDGKATIGHHEREIAVTLP